MSVLTNRRSITDLESDSSVLIERLQRPPAVVRKSPTDRLLCFQTPSRLTNRFELLGLDAYHHRAIPLADHSVHSVFSVVTLQLQPDCCSKQHPIGEGVHEARRGNDGAFPSGANGAPSKEPPRRSPLEGFNVQSTNS